MFSGIATDGSDLYVDGRVWSSEILEGSDRFTALTFLSSHKLAVIAFSYPEHSWIPLPPETSCRDRGGSCGKSLPDIIGLFHA